VADNIALGRSPSSIAVSAPFVGWEWVTEDVVWAKLAALRACADIASKRLWSRKVA
jgi:hypothetical protein